ncbi:MAG: NirD/YgiW/YdeI family stress tolerance protein [Roseitalea sp.]|jgi:uncharacterized protein YdeI (BOF family)|nr:NirD/YgiW/YdeI family stress tolerance protein [Roseitalea sp.]MBO6722405.1 NirD/YgiW/YdeI family stress tolerance protein [Roseitalea sp.]MBO6741981.1 NirD/YgiW/YdeI family stress tolerance protein [Roseitalea sp.]
MIRAVSTAMTMTFFASVSTAFAQTAVTPIDALQIYQETLIHGTIEARLDDDEFRIRDASGTIRVYTQRDWGDYSVGDEVTVLGRLDDDPDPREFYVRRITLADGTVVRLSAGYD